MKRKGKTAAIITINDAPDMTAKGRKRIAAWLRSRAVLLEKNADLMASRFTARYVCK